MIYAANVAEGDMADRGASSSFVQALKVKAEEDNCEVVVISAQVGPCACPPDALSAHLFGHHGIHENTGQANVIG